MHNRIYNIENGVTFIVLFSCSLITLLLPSCKKMVEVPAPVTSINADNVYNSDATAAAVLTGIYTKWSSENRGISGLPSLFFYAGLSADELTLHNLTNTTYLYYYRNSLASQVSGSSFWTWTYPYIFYANSAIEGISNSKSLTSSVKQQLLGEAKFVRAFCYFYLVNLYGNTALITETDWKSNSLLPRSDMAEIWNQIITDLKEAQQLLSADYLESDLLTVTNERVRPTKWAAAALLARAYLHTGDWVNAESHASLVINESTRFDTVSLNNGVFNKNSKEAIWQIQPTGSNTRSNTGEGRIFILPNSGPGGQFPVYLSDPLLQSFEVGDLRKTQWTNKVKVGNTDYYYSYKYKIGGVNTSVKEYIMVLRLAEQYLIRAEARAHQNKLIEAQSDLNTIRKRSGLSSTNATTQSLLLDAILHERQVELFTEWGHRWLDLKRTITIDSVMGSIASIKGSIWKSEWQWYPIPFNELNKNPNLVQNAGY